MSSIVHDKSLFSCCFRNSQSLTSDNLIVVSFSVIPWVHPLWSSLGFLNLKVHFLPQIWGIFGHYFFTHSAPFPLSSLISLLEFLHSHSFFLLFFWLGYFKWPVFKFDVFFLLLKSDIEFLSWTFQLLYSSVPNCVQLFLKFSVSVGFLILSMPHFPRACRASLWWIFWIVR